MGRLERICARLDELLPERHLYIRQGGRMRAMVLTQKKQAMIAGGLGAAALWMGVCTAAMLIHVLQRPARPAPPAAAAQTASAAPSAAALAAEVERRHAALAVLLSEARTTPGAAPALTPPILRALSSAAASADPVAQLKAVQAGQQEVLAATEAFAQARAERLRAALQVAGVAAPPPRGAGGVGGPLIELKDPAALAARYDLDPQFARQLHQTAASLSEAQALSRRAARLPLAAPTRAGRRTGGYGVRVDPFTRRAAFHPGLDFAGARMSPVLATAPGTVVFTGVRTGYGETVEVDHGGGFRTRYAHLARIAVRTGQHVEAGARLGGMGSTGRSTGTHLHYEVWVDGRAQNPARFVRAGAYVLQAGEDAG
jgi:murein DD-endopeptidase MepM/ murein hydrolase activator NlpD